MRGADALRVSLDAACCGALGFPQRSALGSIAGLAVRREPISAS